MKTLLLKTLLVLSFIIMITGAYLKIVYAGNADTFLMLGLISGVVCLAIGLYEVVCSKNIKTEEKFLWAIGFLTLGWPVLLVYVFASRKRILNGPADRLGAA